LENKDRHFEYDVYPWLFWNNPREAVGIWDVIMPVDVIDSVKEILRELSEDIKTGKRAINDSKAKEKIVIAVQPPQRPTWPVRQ